MTSLFTCVFPYKMQNLGGPSVMKKKQKKNNTKTFNKQGMQAQLPPYFVLVLLAVYSSWAHREPQISS